MSLSINLSYFHVLNFYEKKNQRPTLCTKRLPLTYNANKINFFNMKATHFISMFYNNENC